MLEFWEPDTTLTPAQRAHLLFAYEPPQDEKFNHSNIALVRKNMFHALGS